MKRWFFLTGWLILGVCSKLYASETDQDSSFSFEESFSNSFYNLPISEEEKRTISKIVRNLAELSLPRLLWKKREMESMGDSINRVHPLRFLGHVFSVPEHTYHLKEISKSMFKWGAFIDGLKGRLREEERHHNLLQHVEGFASHIDVDPHKVFEYLSQHKWEPLVFYLIHVKSY